MPDTTARLDELAKRASKISDGQAREAASLLLKLYSQTGEKKMIAEYLMKYKATVCLCFFELAVPSMKSGEIEALHAAMCESESYRRNLNHAATTRGFIIAAVLIKQAQKIARAVLVRTLTDVEKDGKFSDTVIEHFKKYVVEYCGFETITKLDERDWKNVESKNRFRRFMQLVSDSIVTIQSTSSYNEQTAATASLPLNVAPPREGLAIQVEAKTEDLTKTTKITNLTTDSRAVAQTAELLRLIGLSHCEAEKTYQLLNQSNGIVGTLHEQVSDRDIRIAKLNAELQEHASQIAALRLDADREKHTNDELQSKISDLTQRLKTSMQMDTISQSQELVTLKTELSNSLKLEYNDYLHELNAECNPDTFGAFRSSLTRIFKTLRRFGIVID